MGKSVSCGEKKGKFVVEFVEFVLRLIFVDLKLSQNPYMPTTDSEVVNAVSGSVESKVL